MEKSFKTGDHVKWNSEAGYVTGKIIKVHTSDFDYKGHTHRASKEEPQYEIKAIQPTTLPLTKVRCLSKYTISRCSFRESELSGFPEFLTLKPYRFLSV
ncbi:DUF2945 domain-containing protein [Adhaeribacter terreus]|uniref:DUF2945 domain-containing protein n=1 Tax=Adhaeribacter terreus TaxID=529703 RepID=A0ABW0EB35_9BACT